MQLALAEAVKGMGRTSPNPCVGAVIVKHGQVIAKGFHEKAGTPHAEVHALEKAGEKAQGATMYVTLEPCSHFGKTPPCAHAIVRAGIKKVVIGLQDPNPLVAGGGRQYLEDNGVSVITSVLEDKCREINLPFIKFITTGEPFVLLKAGMSLDGMLSYQKNEGGWITNVESRIAVHKLRNSYDAILVGRNTIDVDNPALTTRLEKTISRDPVRVILDTHLATSLQSKVYCNNSEAPTIVYCGENVKPERMGKFADNGIEVVKTPLDKFGTVSIQTILENLSNRGIISVLVEGGGGIHSSFLKNRAVDKVALFYGPLFAGNDGCSFSTGVSVRDREAAVKLNNISLSKLGDDFLVEGDVSYPENTE